MGVALMGLPGEVPTAAYVPVLMFAILSGLSMDYEVFMLSRERAQWLRTGGNAGSVVAGLSSTARVISSAALMGIGLETAIAVDATLLRLVLVPATMAPLGNRNWYLPAWLDRVLPHLDTRGTWSKAGSADAEGQRGVRQNPAVVDNHRSSSRPSKPAPLRAVGWLQRHSQRERLLWTTRWPSETPREGSVMRHRQLAEGGSVSVLCMPLSPEEFYAHAVAAADDEQRLSLSRMTEWDISPFEAEGLRVSRLRPPVVPEPPRHGEDPVDCESCRRRDEGIWLDDRWRLSAISSVGVPLALMLHPRDHHDLADLSDDLAAELGVLSTHIARHVQALPHISRCHLYRIGDGGAHLHLWFFARPEGQAQLFGSWLVVWDDLLPEYPADIAQADAAVVADALVASYGGRRGPAAS